MRATVTDMFGFIDLAETLQNPECSKRPDKRLSVEIASLGQIPGKEDARMLEDQCYEDDRLSEDQLSDVIRWIDITVMAASTDQNRRTQQIGASVGAQHAGHRGHRQCKTDPTSKAKPRG